MAVNILGVSNETILLCLYGFLFIYLCIILKFRKECAASYGLTSE